MVEQIYIWVHTTEIEQDDVDDNDMKITKEQTKL